MLDLLEDFEVELLWRQIWKLPSQARSHGADGPFARVEHRLQALTG